MQKAQSILEYLVVLTAIVLVIVIHTFGPFGVRAGVNKAMDKQRQDIQAIIDKDYSGQAVNMSDNIISSKERIE